MMADPTAVQKIVFHYNLTIKDSLQMNHVHNAYRQSRNTSLTRVDTLIKLYQKTITTIENAQQAIESNDIGAAENHKILAYRCLIALLDGIKPEHDEVSANTHRICLYAINQVWEGSVNNFANAAKVLSPIRNAFVAIRDDAVQMELSGEIPALNLETSIPVQVYN